MKCYLYKSLLHPNQVLLLAKQDFFFDVPRKIILQLGDLEFVKELNLRHKEYKSLHAVDEIENNLLKQGYHSQHVFLKR